MTVIHRHFSTLVNRNLSYTTSGARTPETFVQEELRIQRKPPKLMKLFLITLLGIVSFGIGAVPAAEQDTRQTSSGETPASGKSSYANVSDNDKQMDRAVENAQRTLGFFMAALKAKKNGDTVFEIKKGFIDGDKVEHLWIKRVTYDGKNFHGEIDNRPNEVSNVHLGEHVTVAPRDVTDWMFLKDGKLIGGYTTRVLYARLSPEDKVEFDKQAEFKIE
jgi:uncharacterized protein YegJ (DUF2314 family)